MSRRSLDQVLSLLAASGYSEKVIYEAFEYLMRIGPSEGADRVRRLKAALADRHGTSSPTEMGYPGASSGAGMDQLIRMLTDELRLSASEIAYRMAAGIQGRDPGAKLPEFRPKDGLRKWLQQLSRQRSQSEILHIATRIRNEEIHRPSLDWSISKEEK
tara:strand:- start:211 stop:687 length:477 start_codon:yes stop_codon:yes gene_type:complete